MDLLFERWYATLVTTKYLGGAYTARQREALAFITRAGLGEDVYRFSPSLLNKLAPPQWFHWGANPFDGNRIDFPLHDWALALQGTLVDLLIDPGVLARLRDAELRAEARDQVVTIPDVFGTLTTAIWSEGGTAARDAPATCPPSGATCSGSIWGGSCGWW